MPYNTCGNISCVPSSDQIWAQPYFPNVWTGPWNWYPRGSHIASDKMYGCVGLYVAIYCVHTDFDGYMVGFWNTPYGTEPFSLY